MSCKRKTGKTTEQETIYFKFEFEIFEISSGARARSCVIDPSKFWNYRIIGETGAARYARMGLKNRKGERGRRRGFGFEFNRQQATFPANVAVCSQRFRIFLSTHAGDVLIQRVQSTGSLRFHRTASHCAPHRQPISSSPIFPVASRRPRRSISPAEQL